MVAVLWQAFLRVGWFGSRGLNESGKKDMKKLENNFHKRTDALLNELRRFDFAILSNDIDDAHL